MNKQSSSTSDRTIRISSIPNIGFGGMAAYEGLLNFKNAKPIARRMARYLYLPTAAASLGLGVAQLLKPKLFNNNWMQKKAMDLDVNVGDVLLGGRFKNHRIEVKSIGTDELGQPVFNNDRKLLSVRIEKKLPEGMWSSKTLAEKYKEKDMDKKAFLEETYNSAFEDELEKIAVKFKIYHPLIIGDKGFKGSVSKRLNKLIESRNKTTGSKLGNTYRDSIVKEDLKRSAEAIEYNKIMNVEK